MARTKDQTIREITMEYLDRILPTDHINPAIIKADILDELTNAFELENTNKDKGKRWKFMDKLVPAQIALIILRLYHVANIAYAGLDAESQYDVLSIYQSEGEDEGIYISDEQAFARIAQQYCFTISIKELKEVIAMIRREAPRKERCKDRNLIAVNNGIFDYETKTLMPFDPEFVFTAKSKVNYNDQAYNVVIHNPDDNTDWDVESWMADLSDDPEIVNVLWQILGAIIRPNVPWNISAWFYSNTGNNGKGTLCELMRQLCGKGSYASISLSNFSKDFMLEPLIRATAIIVDENDVGTYIDKAANLKAVVTNDVIQINRKFMMPIAYQFMGFMVQCLNELPKVKDKSDSFYRRQLFIPFTKCFTGKERKYIKDDYLKRPEVLEYVMYKVLNMDYYELDMPQACKDALDEYKEFNDPIRQFFNEVVLEASWDFLPLKLLYDLYKIWFKKNNPSGTMLSSNPFKQSLISIVKQSDEWKCPKNKMRAGKYMSVPEPLLYEYGLTDWITDWKNKTMPAQQYGILRITASSANAPTKDVDD